jgi:large subunit ribosomal protein L15
LPTRLRKMRKRRGGRTVGWGQVGQHRKHGAKGGYGKAGRHKHKWSWVVKYAPDYFGSHGFVPPSPNMTRRWMNLSDLEALVQKKGNAVTSKEGAEGLPVIDLREFGVEKLLGGGSIRSALVVKVPAATKSAVEKIEGAGGKVEEV